VNGGKHPEAKKGGTKMQQKKETRNTYTIAREPMDVTNTFFARNKEPALHNFQ